MHSSQKRKQIQALRARGQRMAAARWALDRAARTAEDPERIAEMRERETLNLPRQPGDILGVLQWHDAATGQVRRGLRVDQITVESPTTPASKSHGWAWFFSKLRTAIVRHAPHS